jgi:hypothetical protein
MLDLLKLQGPVGREYELNDGGELWRFVVISKDEQDTGADKVRRFIFQNNHGIRVLQVVGDSGIAFTPEGECRAATLIETIMSLHEKYVLLWGYTGHPGPGRDINQIINDWIDDDANNRSSRCFANIVDLGTRRALQDAHCRRPVKPAGVRNFILVTDGADFGDDIISSDSVTDHLLVFEGGIQSFNQLVNCMLSGCRVGVVEGLRDRNCSDGSRFSASTLIRLLKESGNQNKECVKNEYMATVRPLNDVQRGSFDKAWRRLISLSSIPFDLIEIISS